MALFAALLLCDPGAATAQGTPTQAQANAIRSACRGDYQTHCAGVPTGGTAALSCLQANAAAVSQPCRHALAAIGGSTPSEAPSPSGTPSSPAAGVTRHALREACGADFQTFCPGVRPGGGRVIACLHAHGPDLSPGCQHALQRLRQRQ